VVTNISSLEALGDSTRRKLFEQLRSGPCSVNDLAANLPISQPAVSQHLKVLKDAHLVHFHKRGNQRIYSIDPEGLASLRRYVDELWDDVLGAYLRAADQISQEDQHEHNE
jgi:DNA-binding transcriptional ArsR family regulator